MALTDWEPLAGRTLGREDGDATRADSSGEMHRTAVMSEIEPGAAEQRGADSRRGFAAKIGARSRPRGKERFVARKFIGAAEQSQTEGGKIFAEPGEEITPVVRAPILERGFGAKADGDEIAGNAGIGEKAVRRGGFIRS